ncbi:hypothetical protein DPMN_046618 [Dreissena polymorpha]|uniref:Uncharacterized protein n=1 Tax=Dreissena polymorpha TaxID=45954 RepID=A0A9D4I0R8_DREPO|nr:hypothetical protein DPMN_046618 [Dreissena polymorpha]
MLKLAQTDQQTNGPTDQQTDRSKTISVILYKCKEKDTPGPFHFLSSIWTIFENELVRDISETNVLTKFHDDSRINILTKLHEDWASNVTSTVFTSFELSRGINGTNALAKFHEDQTRQNVDDG